MYETIEFTKTNLNRFLLLEMCFLLGLYIMFKRTKNNTIHKTIYLQTVFHVSTIIFTLCNQQIYVVKARSIFDLFALIFGIIYVYIGSKSGNNLLLGAGLYIIYTHVYSIYYQKHPPSVFGSLYE